MQNETGIAANLDKCKKILKPENPKTPFTSPKAGWALHFRLKPKLKKKIQG